MVLWRIIVDIVNKCGLVDKCGLVKDHSGYRGPMWSFRVS